ncbi:MAG: hypothetical protein AAF252_15325, partial [Pseudomonadota bacterium]
MAEAPSHRCCDSISAWDAKEQTAPDRSWWESDIAAKAVGYQALVVRQNDREAQRAVPSAIAG